MQFAGCAAPSQPGAHSHEPQTWIPHVDPVTQTTALKIYDQHWPACPACNGNLVPYPWPRPGGNMAQASRICPACQPWGLELPMTRPRPAPCASTDPPEAYREEKMEQLEARIKNLESVVKLQSEQISELMKTIREYFAVSPGPAQNFPHVSSSGNSGDYQRTASVSQSLGDRSDISEIPENCHVCLRSLKPDPHARECAYGHWVHGLCVAKQYAENSVICKKCSIGPTGQNPVMAKNDPFSHGSDKPFYHYSEEESLGSSEDYKIAKESETRRKEPGAELEVLRGDPEVRIDRHRHAPRCEEPAGMEIPTPEVEHEQPGNAIF